LALGPPDGDAALPLEDGPADDDSASFDAPNSTLTPGSKRARPEAKPKRGKKGSPSTQLIVVKLFGARPTSAASRV